MLVVFQPLLPTRRGIQMRFNRHSIAIAAVSLAATVVAPAAGQAAEAKMTKRAPTKAMSFEQARKAQKQARKHGFPAGPRVTDESKLVLTQTDDHAVAEQTPAGEQIKLRKGRPIVKPKIFGSVGTY